MPHLSDYFTPDELMRFQELYVDNVVSWVTLPHDVAQVETETRTHRLLNLLFSEGGDEVETAG